METKSPPEEACARCGAPFVCGMKAGEARCWCSDLPALQPVPRRSCLCRACLEEELKAGART
ncbi:MAG: cysteine-rich CWC family protein [Betaproteobacteria bacterium]|nr:cysteine-rich CWC family protein [Betaproteobacteria bacterium]